MSDVNWECEELIEEVTFLELDINISREIKSLNIKRMQRKKL